jgi:hypothetical protein
MANSVNMTLAVRPHLSPITTFVLLAACSGGHDDLGVDDTSSASTAVSVSASAGASSTGTGAGGAPPIEEPDGDPRLTLVNGVVDRDLLQVCLVPEGAPGTRAPFPAAGLAFGTALSIPLPSDDVPALAADARIVLAVITSSAPTPPSTASCADLLADPATFPDLTVLTYGVLPGDTFTAPRSLLMTPGGCFGGAGHEGPKQELVCGLGYLPDAPTPSLLLAPMSRIVKFDRLGVQIAHAASTLPTVDVRIVRSDLQATQFDVAKLVPQGGVFPFPPYPALDLELLGPAASALIRTGTGSTPQPIPGADVTIGTAMANGGHAIAELRNGRGVTFVGVGATPGEAAGPWWHAFTYVAVFAEPPAE